MERGVIILIIYYLMLFVLLILQFAVTQVRCRQMSTFASLLSEVSSLPLPKQRAIAACVGACVADAAARPFHWLYDGEKLESILSEAGPSVDSAFFPRSCSPYYTLPTGANSCYYDLGFTMLKSLSKYGDDEKYLGLQGAVTANLHEMFGPGSEYRKAFERRNEKYDPSKRYDKRDPIDGPWQQSSVTVFLESASGNPASKETDGLVSTLPLIAHLAASGPITPEGQELIRSLASTLSTNVFALSHTLSAALILSSVIRSGEGSIVKSDNVRAAVAQLDPSVLSRAAAAPGQEGVPHGPDLVLAELDAVFAAAAADPTGSDHVAQVLGWGKPCANPGSFQGAIHAVMTSTSFAEGVRRNIRAGGCNCSRANLAGSILGAAFLFDESRGGIPHEWLLKADKGEEVFRLALEKFR